MSKFQTRGRKNLKWHSEYDSSKGQQQYNKGSDIERDQILSELNFWAQKNDDMND
jgi:hypothetical protein